MVGKHAVKYAGSSYCDLRTDPFTTLTMLSLVKVASRLRVPKLDD
jgi:hypothetical protein